MGLPRGSRVGVGVFKQGLYRVLDKFFRSPVRPSARPSRGAPVGARGGRGAPVGFLNKELC